LLPISGGLGSCTIDTAPYAPSLVASAKAALDAQ
jgi:hypothetical protein